jgi:hypothetical protein
MDSDHVHGYLSTLRLRMILFGKGLDMNPGSKHNQPHSVSNQNPFRAQVRLARCGAPAGGSFPGEPRELPTHVEEPQGSSRQLGSGGPEGTLMCTW